jgi:hypothetical protein
MPDDSIQPIFDIEDRGYRVRAFYVPETLHDAEYAHLTITRNGDLVQLGYYMAYRIWNLAAHFRDTVDELIWEGKGKVSNA